MPLQPVRGYFAVGVEGLSKPMNLGNLMRSAHAFGASFIFTVNAHYSIRASRSDTSRARDHIPYYAWQSVAEMALPGDCRLVGVELLEDAANLPSFRHPARAAYVLGREKGALTGEMRARCDFVVQIPAKFCINVATAGAIVMYDRIRSLGQWQARPVRAGGPAVAVR